MRYHSDWNHQYSILKQRNVCLFAGRYLRQTATYQVSNLRVLGALIGPQHLHRYLPISPCIFSSQLFQISPNHFQAIIDAFECLGVHLVWARRIAPTAIISPIYFHSSLPLHHFCHVRLFRMAKSNTLHHRTVFVVVRDFLQVLWYFPRMRIGLRWAGKLCDRETSLDAWSCTYNWAFASSDSRAPHDLTLSLLREDDLSIRSTLSSHV